MKDQRICVRIEAEKKRDFINAMKKRRTDATKFLTYQIDKVIESYNKKENK